MHLSVATLEVTWQVPGHHIMSYRQIIHVKDVYLDVWWPCHFLSPGVSKGMWANFLAIMF